MYAPYNADTPVTCGGASCGGGSLAVNNLQAGQTYYFTVTAVDRAGNESVHSLEVNATPTE